MLFSFLNFSLIYAFRIFCTATNRMCSPLILLRLTTTLKYTKKEKNFNDRRSQKIVLIVKKGFSIKKKCL